LAIPAAAPAMPPKLSAAAISAITALPSGLGGQKPIPLPRPFFVSASVLYSPASSP
jgi:hypothetical protein